MTTPPRPPRRTLVRPNDPSLVARAGEPRFSDQELALILKRAAELQEGVARPDAAQFTLAEIQEIAAEAGISPKHVATVAAGLRDSRAQGAHGVLGAPWRYRFDVTIDGEVADDVVSELIEHVRRELGLQGKVSEALGTVEWSGRDTFGSTHVTIARRGGCTTIGVLSARTDAAALTGTTAAVGALFGCVGVGAVLIATAGLAVPIAGLVAAVGAGGGSWLSMRGMWRHLARRYSERTATLGESLATAARSAVDEGRVADNPGMRPSM